MCHSISQTYNIMRFYKLECEDEKHSKATEQNQASIARNIKLTTKIIQS